MTDDEVAEAFRLGESYGSIAGRCGVSRQRVYQIVRQSGAWAPRPVGRSRLTDEERLTSGLPLQPAGSCWEWAKSRYSNGYGRFDNRRSAHRVAYETWVGPIPDGQQVLHTCDNPPCCNPTHLWAGTPQDNMDDRDRKGRGRYKRITPI